MTTTAFALSDGRTVNIEVRKSTRAKKPAIIADIGGIYATIPPNYEIKNLGEMLSKKMNWITKVSKYYERLRSSFSEYHLRTNTICFFGERYWIKIVKDRYSFAIVSKNLNIVTFHVLDKRRFKHDIFNWYKEETTKVINARLPHIASELNIQYSTFSIRRQHSRWGSCSKKGNLNFNALLSAAPIEVINYVMIHELMHIVEPNHSTQFWNNVRIADPEYIDHKKWLSAYGSLVSMSRISLERPTYNT
jgi:predicted metal-dependent hydrolase